MVSTIKKYFIEIGHKLFQCSVCGDNIKGHNTGNLKSHFQRHPEQYKEFEIKFKAEKGLSTNVSLDSSSSYNEGEASYTNVREYYTRIDDRTYSCALCQKHIQARSTSTLASHLKRKHLQEYDKFYKHKRRRTDDELPDDNDESQEDETHESQAESSLGDGDANRSWSIRSYYTKQDPQTFCCTICQKSVRANRNTSNLLAHMRQHSLAFEDFEKNRELHKAKKQIVKEEEQDQRDGSMDWAYPPDDIVEEDDIDQDTNQVSSDAESGMQTKKNPKTGKRAASSNTSTTADPLKMFFDTMYATVAKMPREDILHARRRVFDVIAEIEEQQHYRQLAVQNPPDGVDNN